MNFNKNDWALILGGSSGFGLATAKKLASMGMNIFVVHRDRRGAMSTIQSAFNEIKAYDVQFQACNIDALSEEGRQTVIDTLHTCCGELGRIKVMLHSIAFGNLKPIARCESYETTSAIADLARILELSEAELEVKLESHLKAGAAHVGLHFLTQPTYSDALIEAEDMARTIYSMGTSMLDWTQALHSAGLFASDARVIGLTSEGNEIAWKGYAAVSAAKVALESVSRSIAVEFAPFGIRSNIVQPGVTDTPALRLIPGSERMKAVAKLKNPFKRLTQPSDVADVIALLALPESHWINGTIIRVDGGERIGSL